jgi:putative nucleotidyltransferase with HDIG domain
VFKYINDIIKKFTIKDAENAYYIGGCTRDFLTGTPCKDIDIVIEKENRGEEFIGSLLPAPIGAVIRAGKSYPIWTGVFKTPENPELDKQTIDVAETMGESFPDKESRQRKTYFSTLEEDIKRRDFTINMIAINIKSLEINNLSKPFIKDINNKVLTHHPAVDPEKMFYSDPLRILRMCRFGVKGWNIDKNLLIAAKNQAERIKIVSTERIIGEIKKIIDSGQFYKAILLFKDINILDKIFPSVYNTIDVGQGDKHHQEGDVFTHTVMVLKEAPQTLIGQLVALYHDVGKPYTKEEKDGKVTFLGHQDESEKICRKELFGLKLDNDTINTVANIVKYHMYPFLNQKYVDKKIVRRFIRKTAGYTENIIEQCKADCLGRVPRTIDIQKFIDIYEEI